MWKINLSHLHWFNLHICHIIRCPGRGPLYFQSADPHSDVCKLYFLKKSFCTWTDSCCTQQIQKLQAATTLTDWLEHRKQERNKQTKTKWSCLWKSRQRILNQILFFSHTSRYFTTLSRDIHVPQRMNCFLHLEPPCLVEMSQKPLEDLS